MNGPKTGLDPPSLCLAQRPVTATIDVQSLGDIQVEAERVIGTQRRTRAGDHDGHPGQLSGSLLDRTERITAPATSSHTSDKPV